MERGQAAAFQRFEQEDVDRVLGRTVGLERLYLRGFTDNYGGVRLWDDHFLSSNLSNLTSLHMRDSIICTQREFATWPSLALNSLVLDFVFGHDCHEKGYAIFTSCYNFFGSSTTTSFTLIVDDYTFDDTLLPLLKSISGTARHVVLHIWIGGPEDPFQALSTFSQLEKLEIGAHRLQISLLVKYLAPTLSSLTLLGAPPEEVSLIKLLIPALRDNSASPLFENLSVLEITRLDRERFLELEYAAELVAFLEGNGTRVTMSA